MRERRMRETFRQAVFWLISKEQRRLVLLTIKSRLHATEEGA